LRLNVKHTAVTRIEINSVLLSFNLCIRKLQFQSIFSITHLTLNSFEHWNVIWESLNLKVYLKAINDNHMTIWKKLDIIRNVIWLIFCRSYKSVFLLQVWAWVWISNTENQKLEFIWIYWSLVRTVVKRVSTNVFLPQ